jgi:hypothetical protein
MIIEKGKAILDKALMGAEMAHKKCCAVEVGLAQHSQLAQEEEDHQQKLSQHSSTGCDGNKGQMKQKFDIGDVIKHVPYRSGTACWFCCIEPPVI